MLILNYRYTTLNFNSGTMATSPQQPVHSVPWVAVVERFNCDQLLLEQPISFVKVVHTVLGWVKNLLGDSGACGIYN